MGRLLCSLHGQDVVQLAQDPVTGDFTVIGKIYPKSKHMIAHPANSYEEQAIVTTSNPRNITNTTGWLSVSARRCTCNDNESNVEVYCLSKFAHCKAIEEGMPACFTIAGGESFACAAIPLICVWYATMFCWLVTTSSGRSVLAYFVSCCYPKWTDHEARRLLSQDPSLAFRLITRNELRARGQLPNGTVQTVSPTSGGGCDLLGLHTKLHGLEEHDVNGVAKEEEDNVADEESDRVCVICFGPIEIGDRVGDLPCNHIFHAACLKEWLIRRQVCPLCQRDDVVQHVHRRSNMNGRTSARLGDEGLA